MRVIETSLRLNLKNDSMHATDKLISKYNDKMGKLNSAM